MRLSKDKRDRHLEPSQHLRTPGSFKVCTVTITAKQLQNRFPHLLEKFGRGEGKILLEMLDRIEVEPGTELHRYGDPDDSLYLIWEGKVMLSMPVAGRDIALGVLGSGQLIGAVAVVVPGPAPVTAMAAEPSVLLRLDHAGLETLRKNHPRIGGHFLQALSLNMTERLRIYEEYMSRRTRTGDPEEFVRLCQPLMGVKEAT